MIERITFIVSDPSHTNPDNFILGSDSLKIKSLPNTAREDRLTFDSNALPPPFKKLLEKVELGHLRWSSGRFYEAANPYAARVPAGLHILTTPGRLQETDFFPEESEKKEVLEKNYDDPFLSAAWGINHSRELRVEHPFKIGPWESTFYSPVQEITPFRDFLKKVLDNQKGVLRADNLNWMKRLDRLQDADYVDVKYDAVSQKVEVSVYWGPSEVDRSGYLVTNAEVGIMGTDKAEEEEAVKVAGYIYEIGDSDHLEAVMFSFPSRHHEAPSTFTLTTNTPTGLHPTLHLSLSGPLTPPREDGDCTLNAYFTLPPSLFVDKYQLSSTNANLLRQLNIRRLRDVTGNTDLEAPEYNIQDWGSRVLIEIDADSTEGSNSKTLEVELPLHLRYLRPAVNSSSTEVTFAWPSVFWACKSESWRKMSNSPFDRVGLGWEDLFPEQVMYYHLSPVPGEKAPVENGTWGRIQAPVLDRGWGNEEMIKTWTVAAVGIGFVWVIGAVLWARVLGTKKEVKKEEVAKKVQ